MDKNTIIGIVLIFLLFYLWARMNAPTEEQLAEMQRVKDSIALAEQTPVPDTPGLPSIEVDVNAEAPTSNDSVEQLILQRDYGAFAPAASGNQATHILENEVMRISFDTKGGAIRSILLKKYQKLIENEQRKDEYQDLYLLEDEKNRFEYIFPVPSAANGRVRSGELFFDDVQIDDQSIRLTAHLGPGRSFSQIYTLTTHGYELDYRVEFKGLDKMIDPKEKRLQLHWVNYLDKIEKNDGYERIVATIYYKETDEDPTYCSSTGDDVEEVESALKWVSHSHQFFNTTLIADQSFERARLETITLDEDNEDLKLANCIIDIPLQGTSDESIDMSWYLGPNEFERLQDFQIDLEDIIPFGWSIFGTINRWVIRPIFNFLSRYIGSAGIVILLLTLIVKSLVYPLTYKMLYSQSKMGALKPQMAKLKEKYKDDAQKVQMETMKIYREYGVNPAGGCFPMVLQMPIWFALYRFFPASIEFRQASFLWANDLSSYDVFFQLPFEIPFLGSHLSLFTFLWAISMLIYTYYNSKIMDMSSINPMMKYMQYVMPLMFVFFFNSYASGLTCYLLFSNLLNITQTLVTKNYLIDNDKIMVELNANKKKPKKKGGFQERLAKALEEQQRIAEQRTKRK